MKISYDSNYDVLYTVDRDSQGRITGIEVLAASKHLNLAALLPVELAH